MTFQPATGQCIPHLGFPMRRQPILGVDDLLAAYSMIQSRIFGARSRVPPQIQQMPVLGDADLLDRRVIVNAMGWRASMCVFAQTHLSAAFIHNCRSSGPAGAEPGDSLTHASTPRCIANAYHETGDAAMAEDSRDGTSDGPAMCTCPGRRSQLPEYLRSLQVMNPRSLA